MGNQLCQLRVTTFTLEDKLVVQSRRLWGSSVEERLGLVHFVGLLGPACSPCKDTGFVWEWCCFFLAAFAVT